MEVLMLFSGGLDIIPVLLWVYLIYYHHNRQHNKPCKTVDTLKPDKSKQ